MTKLLAPRLMALTITLGLTAPLSSVTLHAAQTVPQEVLETRLKKDSDDLYAREHLALAHLEGGRFDDVIELLNPYTDVASPRSFLTLAAAYNQKKDYDSVVRVLSLLADKRPKDAHIQYMLGDARLKLADTQRDNKLRLANESTAIECFRNALRLQRNLRIAHDALVNYFLKINSNHEARELLSEMMGIYGLKGAILTDLCRLNSIDGYLSQAVRMCMKAIQVAPQEPENYVYLAQSYFDQKQLDRAETTLVGAARKFSKSEFVQYGTGLFFLKKKNFPVAMKYMKKAVEGDANSARANLGLGQALFETNKPADALTYLSKACQLDGAHQTELLASGSKLRLKGEGSLASKYQMAASNCKRH